MTDASRAPGRVRHACLNLACAAGVLAIVWFLLSSLLGWSLVLFKTGSMAPTYPTGAAGIAVPVEAGDIETGDVVTVPRAQGGLPVTHRVVSVEDPGAEDGSRELVLQGDDNATPDREVYTVTEADKVLVGAPYVGYAVTLLAQPKTLAIVTAAMAALTVWVFWPRPGLEEDRLAGDGLEEDDGPDEDDAGGGGAQRGDSRGGAERRAGRAASTRTGTAPGTGTATAAGSLPGTGTADERVLVATGAVRGPTRATLRAQDRGRRGRRAGSGRESPR